MDEKDINKEKSYRERGMENYVLRRKSMIGAWKRGLAIVSLVIGSGIVGYNLFGSSNMDSYGYDENYDSYSDQLENLFDVDLEEGLKKDLNSMQNVMETINDYMNDNALISRSDAFKMLLNSKYDFEQSALRIAKNWCANKYGGAVEDWKIEQEDSKHPQWIAYCQEYGAHEVYNNEVVNLLEAIGTSQMAKGLDNEENPDYFVSLCDKIVKYSGKVASSISPSKKI